MMYKAVDYPHWCQAWKLAAKKWYAKCQELLAKVNELKVQLIEADTLASDYHGWFRDAEDTASRRLELLRRVERNIFWCPICLRQHFKHGHADDCDLAKELRDSRLARELGDD